ncbi:gibberellin 2-beta-dioxygenase 1-like [Phragmites australis]|uniref:gibberellin 2-beta-dioxygenase 1-like n=1 Tax=Phragmites australis TaxID=29695 RepID=UPI002D7786EA|nr:gibberellin 2-beta-dioxygenase 1-like [Phragmites australis]
MVVPSSTPVHQETAALSSPTSHGGVAAGGGGIPTVDMSAPRGRGALSRHVSRACAEHGFFRAVNHGVRPGPAARLDAATTAFFALAPQDKQRAGPPSPLGYGCRSIGFNGDAGELEYLLLHANPAAVAHRARSIDTDDPLRFSTVVNEYVEAARQLACEILDLLGEGLGLKDPRSFSKLITDTDSDSLLRINHYPAACTIHKLDHDDQCKMKSIVRTKTGNGVNPTAGARIGFGEHTDPQILSLLRANDVNGLQVLLPNGEGKEVWVQVPADPSAFFVNVGDLLQALTNGKLVSIRHRVIASACRPRLSTIYFAAPPLHARISALPETITASAPRQYRPFTWAEYKKTMYSLRLSHSRLDLFHVVVVDDDDSNNVGDGEGEQE